MKERMRPFVSILVLVISTLAGWMIFAQSFEPEVSPVEAAARDAVFARDDVARRARARLRAMGPAGLEALFSVHAAEVGRLLEGVPAGAEVPASWARLRGAIDAVARQRDAHASRLYWYTDMKAARDAARTAHRPILSLRLLGNLDDELSCANSRYFRTALYANRAISDRLRAGWILHWESVRPAPQMTIDFGDGRRIERTVTGNSLHYVLDEDERVLDVLPGLMGPGLFFRELGGDEELAARVASLGADEKTRLIADFHRKRILATETLWASDLEHLGVRPVPDATVTSAASGGARPPERSEGTDAISASRVGVGTASRPRHEAPMKPAMTRLRALAHAMDADHWQALGDLHSEDARLGPGSVALMRLKTHGVYSDASFGRVVEKFERAYAADGLRNIYMLRPVIDAWFADEAVPDPDLATLTAKIYDEVFLTPRRDPWMGLVPPETYSAIEGDGRQMGSADAGRSSIDGVPLPTDEEILRLGPPPTAKQASVRAGVKTLLELPAIEGMAPSAGIAPSEGSSPRADGPPRG